MRQLIRSDKGMSLMESMIAMALMGAAALGSATYFKNIAIQDARVNVGREIASFQQDGVNFFANPDVCLDSVYDAFSSGIPAPGPANGVPGRIFRRIIRGGVDTGEEIEYFRPHVNSVNDSIDPGGKVKLVAIIYSLLQNVPPPDRTGPYNVGGEFQVRVELEYCAGGGRHDACPQELTKKALTVSKFFAAKVTDGSIETRRDPVTNLVTPRMRCADSQDGIYEAARNYADLKVCVAEAKMLALMGRSGSLDCGLQVEGSSEEQVFSPGTITSLPLPRGSVISSLEAEVIGGGGGGGGGGEAWTGSNNLAGKGGTAAVRAKDKFTNITASSCTVKVGIGGRGGEGGSGARDGTNGGLSEVDCDGRWKVYSPGGRGGNARDNSLRRATCGEDGEASFYGRGASGWKNNEACRDKILVAAPGAGGGGGSDDNNTAEPYNSGRNGGDGFVRVKWVSCKVTDTEGVLEELGMDISDICGGGGSSAECTQKYLGSWENEGSCFPCDPNFNVCPSTGSGYVINQRRPCVIPDNVCPDSRCTEETRLGNCAGRNSPPTTCFVAGTQVRMKDYSQKNIEDIRVGERIIDGEGNVSIVTKQKVIYYEGLIYGFNGQAPFFTPNHPFKTLNGWRALDPKAAERDAGVKVELMKVGDVVLRENGKLEAIYILNSQNHEDYVYNITVDETHEYIADGYQVHNGSN